MKMSPVGQQVANFTGDDFLNDRSFYVDFRTMSFGSELHSVSLKQKLKETALDVVSLGLYSTGTMIGQTGGAIYTSFDSDMPEDVRDQAHFDTGTAVPAVATAVVMRKAMGGKLVPRKMPSTIRATATVVQRSISSVRKITPKLTLELTQRLGRELTHFKASRGGRLNPFNYQMQGIGSNLGNLRYKGSISGSRSAARLAHLQRKFRGSTGSSIDEIISGGGGYKRGRITSESGTKLLSGELDVNDYGKFVSEAGDNLTPHHMPSVKYLKEKLSIHRDDGIAMNMEDYWPKAEGRHSLTRTYRSKGRNPDLMAEDFRTALARDIWDVRNIYQKQGLYGPEVRSALQKVIKRWRNKRPDLFIKK